MIWNINCVIRKSLCINFHFGMKNQRRIKHNNSKVYDKRKETLL
jgi:hypothetical protein